MTTNPTGVGSSRNVPPSPAARRRVGWKALFGSLAAPAAKAGEKPADLTDAWFEDLIRQVDDASRALDATRRRRRA